MLAANGSAAPFHWRGRPVNNATEAYMGILGIVNNIYSMRAQALQRQLDPRRDLDSECGYPTSKEMTPKRYKDLYDREPYANRAVQLWPKESWQVTPWVYELERTSIQTPFEKYWDALGRRLRGDSSYYGEEKGSAVWEYLLRADIQCGIGEFAIILLGLDDTYPDGRGVPLNKPVYGIPMMPDCVGYDDPSAYSYTSQRPKTNPLPVFEDSAETAQDEAGEAIPSEDEGSPSDEESSAGMKDSPQEETPLYNLLYMRVFPQTQVTITQYETNTFNPRFGQPVMYEVQTHDPSALVSGDAVTTPTIKVHWSRIIHIVDNIESNETHGKSRLEPILNPIMDIKKVRGSSAEMYYKGAFPGISIESIPQFGAEVVVDEEKLKDMMELYQQSIQRFIALFGMTAKSLAPQVVDPTPQILAQIQAICVQLACPMRVFMGSERGELASSQDDQAWNDRLRERQGRHITPRIICVFVDRLIMLKVLPRPKKGYKVWWPDLASQTAQEKAQVALTTIQALSTYVQGGVESVLHLVDFFTRVLGWSEEEAYAALQNVLPELKKQDTEEDVPPADTEPASTQDSPKEKEIDLQQQLKDLGSDIINRLEALVGKPVVSIPSQE